MRTQLFHFQGLQIKTITFTNVGERFLKSRIAMIFTIKIVSRRKYIKNQCFKVKMSIHLFVFCASPRTRLYTYLIFLRPMFAFNKNLILLIRTFFMHVPIFFSKQSFQRPKYVIKLVKFQRLPNSLYLVKCFLVPIHQQLLSLSLSKNSVKYFCQIYWELNNTLLGQMLV